MFTDAKDALTFMTGGNATVTLTSRKTGKHFTFKVQKPTKTTDRGGKVRDHNADAAFVKLLTGSPSNWEDWSFIGTLMMESLHLAPNRRKPGIGETPSFKAFRWTIGQLVKGEIPADLEIAHSGSCCRCGRELTHPDSIQNGIGPECIKQFS